MYTKDLTEILQLRLSKEDYSFITWLADVNKLSKSEVIRRIILDYKQRYELDVFLSDEDIS